MVLAACVARPGSDAAEAFRGDAQHVARDVQAGRRKHPVRSQVDMCELLQQRGGPTLLYARATM